MPLRYTSSNLSSIWKIQFWFISDSDTLIVTFLSISGLALYSTWTIHARMFLQFWNNIRCRTINQHVIVGLIIPKLNIFSAHNRLAKRHRQHLNSLCSDHFFFFFYSKNSSFDIFFRIVRNRKVHQNTTKYLSI